jgi:hypothetical protein
MIFQKAMIQKLKLHTSYIIYRTIWTIFPAFCPEKVARSL